MSKPLKTARGVRAKSSRASHNGTPATAFVPGARDDDPDLVSAGELLEGERARQPIECIQLDLISVNLQLDRHHYSYSGMALEPSEDRRIVLPSTGKRVRWSTARQARYVEAVLLGMPVLPVVVYSMPTAFRVAEGDAQFAHGDERLRALHAFFHKNLRLPARGRRAALGGLCLMDFVGDDVLLASDSNTSVPLVTITADARDGSARQLARGVVERLGG